MCPQRHSKMSFELLKGFRVTPERCPLYTRRGRLFLRSRKSFEGQFYLYRGTNCTAAESQNHLIHRNMKKENENRGSYDNPKLGKHSKETRKTHCVMVRFDDEEWLKFLSMYDQSGVYARSVFIKARVFSQPFRVIKTDKTLLDYYTKLSSFHAQYRAVGNNYNQVVKELRVHFSEKKAMALLYKLEKCTQELVRITQEIVLGQEPEVLV